LDGASIYGAEFSSFKKPRNLSAALALSSIRPGIRMDGCRSPVSSAPVVFAALAFSSIQRRIHMGDSQSPVFSASPVLIHISQPEKRLVNGGWLLVYSVK
jgi:hypothetical protein